MVLLKNITIILLFLLLISFNQSCNTAPFGQHADSLFLVTNNVAQTYDLKKPAEKYYLPYVLEEISGLTFKSPNSVLAVDDESGRIFEFNLDKKEITHSIEFYKADDYEGIELVGDKVFVLKNDGDLFHFNFTEEKKSIAEKIENKLSSRNDTEGLGFDSSKNILLIACKEDPDLDDSNITGRAFYEVNLRNLSLNENPIFTIDPKKLKAFWEAHKEIVYDEKRIKFKPSSIAVHPISGDYYILSSVGKMLIVTEPNGDIKATYPIAPRVLGQPEGLCFDSDGTMFISSEGEGDRGYILKFNLQQKSDS